MTKDPDQIWRRWLCSVKGHEYVRVSGYEKHNIRVCRRCAESGWAV